MLNEFVEEQNKLDQKFNEQLADKMAKDFVNFTGSAFHAGSRLFGLPFVAPTQEFINPLLKDSDIKFIREITFSDTENPQALAEQIWRLDRLRHALDKKGKKTRLTQNEDVALIALNRTKSMLDTIADQMRDESRIEQRKHAVLNVQRQVESVEQRLSDMGISMRNTNDLHADTQFQS